MAKLDNVLWDISILILDASNGHTKDFGWIPPTCPYCHSPLSGKFASDRLICLQCGREFNLKEVKSDAING
jgi:hypothetical protein